MKKMFKALKFAFINELIEIKNSTYKLLLITLFPLLTFIIIIAIFQEGVAFKMPIVVVDKDNSSLSRKLLSNINATPAIQIINNVANTKEAILLIQDQKAYALVEIPAHFQRDTLLLKTPKVTAMINTQYILIGKIIKAALLESVATSAAQVEFLKDLINTHNKDSALKNISPITLQITPFFNTYKNYSLFLVSALIPSLWQIFIVISTIVSFGTLFKEKKEQEFFQNDFVKMKIIGKLLPYTFVFTLMGTMFLLYFYGSLAWVFEGSYLITIFAMFLTVVAYQVVALALFVSGFDYARALSLGAVYTAPAFAFLGVTFPANNMNSFALIWRDLLPISHYIELQISQANYGANLYQEFDKLFYLLAFWFLIIPVFMRFKHRLQR